MSWKVQALVGERVCGSITRKMVLLNMASRANDDGTGVYASLSMIAGWCEVEMRTVRRVVRELEGDGLIVLSGQKQVKNGWINEWRVAVEMVETLPLYKDEVAAKRAEKATPDTVSGVRKQRYKTKRYGEDPGRKTRPDIKPARTQSPQTPDTESASSIPEPSTSSSLTIVREEEKRVVRLRPGEGSEALALFVEAAQRAGWRVPRGQPNDARKRAIRARLSECGGLDGWREQLALAETQPFLGGDNDRGWRMGLDFFASPRGWTNIAEGAYQFSRPAKRPTHDRNGNHNDPGYDIRRPKISASSAILLRQMRGEPGR
jgi:hypothetical protein